MKWPLHSSGRLSSFIHLAHTYGSNPDLGIVHGEKASNKPDPHSVLRQLPFCLQGPQGEDHGEDMYGWEGEKTRICESLIMLRKIKVFYIQEEHYVPN